MLTPEFKEDVMNNAAYGLPTTPLTYDYAPELVFLCLATLMAAKVGIVLGLSLLIRL